MAQDPGRSTYFDVFADDYEEFVGGLPDAHPFVAAALADLRPPLGIRAPRVLDLGGGTGRTSAMVTRLFPDADIDLVDASPRMLARMTTRGVRTIRADVDDFLGAGADLYDLVVSVAVLELLPDLPATLARIARRLAPDGVLAFTHEPLVHGAEVRGRGRHDIGLDGTVLSITRHDLDDVDRALADAGLRAVVSRLVPGIPHADGVGVYHLVVARPH